MPSRRPALRPFPAALRLTALAACLLAAGCSMESDAPKSATLYPVKGKVTLPGGKPLSGGRVVLVSADGLIAPGGSVGSDGTFTIKSGDDAEGAPAGDYKVRIEPDPAAKKGKPPFPPRYTEEDASGLKVVVKAEPNDLALNLSAKDDRPAAQKSAGGRDRD